jgi:hypothetical protein
LWLSLVGLFFWDVDQERFRLVQLTFKAVTASEWQDLQTLFREPGVQDGCWCMYWRVKRADFHKNYGESNRLAMGQVIAAGKVPGLLAYYGRKPVGWISIAPRQTTTTRRLRSYTNGYIMLRSQRT